MVRNWDTEKDEKALEAKRQGLVRHRVRRPLPSSEQRMAWSIAASVLFHAALLAFVPGFFHLGHNHHERVHNAVDVILPVRIVKAASLPKPTPTPTPTPQPTPRPASSPTAKPTPNPVVAPRVPTTPTPRQTVERSQPRSANRPRIASARTVPAAPLRGETPRSTGPKNRIITSLPGRDAPAESRTFTMASGGNARPGELLGNQGDGVASVVSSGSPVSRSHQLAEGDSVSAPTKKLAQSTEGDESAKPSPAPTPQPRPSGPTREAEAVSTIQPTLPDSLKTAEFKSFVRVRVEVNADGTTNVSLRTTSGNTEVDQRILAALKQWKWKPALKNGMPIESVQLFKFEIEVN